MTTASRATLIALCLLTGPAACVTGSTYKSGVRSRTMAHAPWVAGGAASRDTALLGLLPIVWQRGATPASFGEPKSTGQAPVDSLLSEMNAFIARHATPHVGTLPLIVSHSEVPPDVKFGCPLRGAECDEDAQVRIFGSRSARMQLEVGRPSASWVRAVQERMDSAKVSNVLVLTLEIGDYVARQSSSFSGKSVELGPGHAVPLSWLTSTTTPVSVVQITGVVVDRHGLARRAAAEGIMARTPGGVLSALGVQAVISDADLRALRTVRREDVPGKPLAWEVALQNVFTQLAGPQRWNPS